MKNLQRLIIFAALFGVLLVPSSAQTWGVLMSGGVTTAGIETVTTPVTIASGSTIIDGGFCAIPRYHLVFNPSTTSTLYTVFGRTDAAGCAYYSSNSGASWSALGASTFKQDYHTGIDVDSSGRVFLGGRHDDEMGVPYSRRYHIDHWDSEIVWDDYSGAVGTALVIAGNGNDVWAFERGDGNTAINYRSSADNGDTWSGLIKIVDAVSTTNRIGALMISGQPALLLWERHTGNDTHFKIYRWDGADSFDAVANNTLVSSSDSSTCRLFSMTQTDDGTIHCVFRDMFTSPSTHYHIMHAYRTLAGSWSTPSEIELLAGDYGEMSLTHNGNSVYMFYVDKPGATIQAFYKRLLSGSTWTTATQLSITVDGAVGNISAAKYTPAGVNYIPAVFNQVLTGTNYAKFVTVVP